MRRIQQACAIPDQFTKELMGGIDKEGHDSRLAIHLRVAVATFTFLLHSVSAGIPVLMRESEEPALSIKEGKIHSPGINTKGFYPTAILGNRQF